MRKIHLEIVFFILLASAFLACKQSARESERKIPLIGFLDFIQDPTVDLARQGFFDALKEQGFSEADSSIQVVYANAQGDIPVLGQACDMILSRNPDLIAANVTLSTITAVKKTQSVPIFMMVAPRPDIAGLTDAEGRAPANLFGTYETLDYIDSAVAIIHQLIPGVRRLGTVYNQSEPQSRDAYDVVDAKCRALGIELVSLPVNNSSEAQLVTAAVLNKKVDAFFALPDNVIFAAFETVARACDEARVPVFTSEAGLVARGALASYGADFFYWGYQTGNQAALFLKAGSTAGLKPEPVALRRRIYNPEMAARYQIIPDSTFTAYKPGR